MLEEMSIHHLVISEYELNSFLQEWMYSLFFLSTFNGSRWYSNININLLRIDTIEEKKTKKELELLIASYSSILHEHEFSFFRIQYWLTKEVV